MSDERDKIFQDFERLSITRKAMSLGDDLLHTLVKRENLRERQRLAGIAIDTAHDAYRLAEREADAANAEVNAIFDKFDELVAELRSANEAVS